MRRQQARRRAVLALMTCLVLSSAPLLAGSDSAYKWTVDQRLRARFDPYDMEKRLEAIDMVPRPERGTCVVDGARNSELLLPSELFLALLKQGFDPDPDARKLFRTRIKPVAADLGIGPELWPALKELAAGLLPSASNSGEIGEGLTRDELCRDSFEALAAARKAFGQKSFDRMLYEAVAPGLKVALKGSLSELEKELREMEDGCRESSRTPGL